MSFSRYNIVARVFQATEHEIAKLMEQTSLFMPRMERLVQASNFLSSAVENYKEACYSEPGRTRKKWLRKTCKDIRRAQIALGIAVLFPLRPNDESPLPFGISGTQL